MNTTDDQKQQTIIDFQIARSLLTQLFEQYKVPEWKFIQKGDNFCRAHGQEGYINDCYIIGREYIQIGIYDNPYLMLAGGLHELGHFLTDNDKIIEQYGYTDRLTIILQSEAWKIAFEIADKYQINITQQMLQYRDECLESYKNDPNQTTIQAIRQIEQLGKYQSFDTVEQLFEQLQKE